MKLKTKVLTPENTQLDVEFEIIEESGGLLTAILKHNSERLGYADFSVEGNTGNEHIFVKLRVSEAKTYKGVGSALGEGLFRYSMMMGFGGKLENDTVGKSHVFHYKWGLRPISSIVYNWGAMSKDLEKLFQEYWSTSDSEKKRQISQKIKQHESYRQQEELLLEKRQVKELTPDEVAESVKIDLAIQLEQKILELIKAGMHQSEKLISISMYLPDEKIEEKKKLYEITPELIIEDLKEEINRKNLLLANSCNQNKKLEKEIANLKKQLENKMLFVQQETECMSNLDNLADKLKAIPKPKCLQDAERLSRYNSNSDAPLGVVFEEIRNDNNSTVQKNNISPGNAN